jgi:hypothetical protein
MDKVSHPLQACRDIFFKPNGVFTAIKESHNWSWLPFFIVLFTSILPVYLYFNFVDFQWYTQLIIDSSYGDISPAEQNMISTNMSQEQMPLISSVMIFFGLIITNAIVAVYLNFSAKMDEECVQGFTDWYGFSWWTCMPGVVNSLIALLVILLAGNTQLSPISMSPTSLAYLFNINMASDWYTLLQSVRIDTFWTMYLISVGLSRWTKIASHKTYLIAIGPYGLIWGIWILTIVL